MRGSEYITRRAEEVFGKLDVDNDGELTMEEFVEGYLKLHQESALSKQNSLK